MMAENAEHTVVYSYPAEWPPPPGGRGCHSGREGAGGVGEETGEHPVG